MLILGASIKLRLENARLRKENGSLKHLVNLLGLKMVTLEKQVASLNGELAGQRFALLALSSERKHESTSPNAS